MAQTKKIKFAERVTVYATAACKHHKAGDELKLHPVQAEAFKKEGKATETQEEALKTAEKPEVTNQNPSI